MKNNKNRDINYLLENMKTINEVNRFRKFNIDNYKDIKYLELGSGVGFNLINSLKNGYNIIGVEPGNTFGFEGRYDLCLELMKVNNIENPEDKIVNAIAENLPFNNEVFDFIFSIAVLEHVSSIEKSIKEANRVLKKNGIIYMNVPNYNSFYEGHYNILWFPYILMSKKIAKFYLELRGIDSSYVDELNFTTPSKIINIAKKNLEGNFECFPHIDGFLSIFGLIYFAQVTNTMNDRKIIQNINKFKIVKNIVKLISWLVVKSYFILGCAKTFNFIYIKK